jgi:hypothetical protein
MSGLKGLSLCASIVYTFVSKAYTALNHVLRGKKLVGLHRKQPEPITLPLLCVFVKETIIREFFSGAAITNFNLVFLKVMETDLMLYIFREYKIPQYKIPQCKIPQYKIQQWKEWLAIIPDGKLPTNQKIEGLEEDRIPEIWFRNLLNLKKKLKLDVWTQQIYQQLIKITKCCILAVF